MSKAVGRRLLLAGCALAALCAVWAAIGLARGSFDDFARREPLTWLYLATDAWLAAFATLITIRRGDTSDARLIALILLALAFGDLPIWIETGSASADKALNVIAALILIGSTALLAYYFSRFARPLSPLRRVLTGFVYASSIVQAVVVAAAFAAAWQTLLWSFLEIGSLLCGILAAAAAHGAERRRIAWAVASFAPALGGYAVWHTIMLVAPSSPVDVFFRTFESCLWLLAPVALSYSLLTHRFIDIGFVLNRATIFALVTLIVVGIFVVLEWSLGMLFEHMSGGTNLSINVIVALAVGYSLRFIHAQVDRAVDTLFFKKRHENEMRLRRFAREAEFISDRETLLRRAVDVVRDSTGAQSIEILLERGGVYRSAASTSSNGHVVDANDPVILSMKAWHEPIALHAVKSAIHGDLAFPIGVRGAVAGVLVCGAKETGESYAPDEADALDEVARGIGSTLGGLHEQPFDVVGIESHRSR